MRSRIRARWRTTAKLVSGLLGESRQPACYGFTQTFRVWAGPAFSPASTQKAWASVRSRSRFEERFAEREVSFGQREVEQPKKPRFLTYWGFAVRYGAWHAFDEVSIAPPIEEAMESVAPVVLPTNGVDRVYGRRVPGRITVAESAVVAVNRITQSLLHDLAIGQPDLGQLGDYGGGEFSHRGKGTFCGNSAVALGVPNWSAPLGAAHSRACGPHDLRLGHSRFLPQWSKEGKGTMTGAQAPSPMIFRLVLRRP